MLVSGVKNTLLSILSAQNMTENDQFCKHTKADLKRQYAYKKRVPLTLISCMASFWCLVSLLLTLNVFYTLL